MNENWILDNSANRLKKTYLNEFLDISNGNLIIRNGNVNIKSSNVSVTGNLYIYDDCSFNSKLFVLTDLSTSNLVSNQTINVSNMIVKDTFNTNYLQVNGNSQLNSKLYVNRDASMSSRLIVSNDGFFNSKLLVYNDVSLNNNLLLNNITSFNNNLFVTEDVSLNTRLFVKNDASFNSKIFVLNDVNLLSQVNATQDVSFNSRLFILTDASLINYLTINNNASVNSANFNNNISINHTNPIVSVDVSAADAIKLPTGTTAQQPSGLNGYIRYNNNTNSFEGYSNGNWTILEGLSNYNKTVYVSSDTSLAFYTNSAPILHILATNDISINNNVVIASDTSFNQNINIVGHNGITRGLKLNNNLIQVTSTQLNYINVQNIGIAEPNKALVLDTNNDISGIKDITISGNVNNGNLLVSNSVVSVNATNTVLSDNLIHINSNPASDTDAGVIITRYNTSNLFMGWDKSNSNFIFGNTSVNGNSILTDLVVVPGTINAFLDGSINITSSTNNLGNVLFGNTASSYNRINTINNLSFNPTNNNLTVPHLTGNITGNSTISNSLNILSNSTNNPYYLTFVTNNGVQNLSVNTNLTINPSSNRIIGNNFIGTITKSVQPNITQLPNITTVGTITSGSWNGTVTSLANNAITSSKISGTIPSSIFNTAAITSSKILASSISSESFSDGAFNTNNFQDNSIHANKLANTYITIGSTQLALSNAYNNISVTGNITASTVNVGNTIIGSLYGNVTQGTQGNITTLSALNTVGSINNTITSSGPLKDIKQITVSGSFNQYNGTVTLGNTTFNKYPIGQNVINTDTNALATKLYVDSRSGGSSTLVKLSVNNTITAPKTFKNIAPSQQIMNDLSFITLPYENTQTPANSYAPYISNRNNPNGYYALAKNAARTVKPEIADRSLSYWLIDDAVLTTSDTGKWKSICWSPKLRLFCAVREGASANNFARSADGILWSVFTVTGSDWKSICWSPELNKFCAVGTNSLNATSSDGITWTSSTISGTYALSSVCWCNLLRVFCAVCNNQSEVFTSSNGSNWTYTNNSITNTSWYSVIWAPEIKLFCAVASNANYLSTSSNGINWTNYSNVFTTTPINANVIWAPELYIFCIITNNYTLISSNGSNWSNYTIPTPANTSWGPLVWSPELSVFCAIDKSNSGWAYSFTGKEWFFKNGMTSRPTLSVTSSTRFQSIVWSPEVNRFCTIGYTGTGTSSDKSVCATCSTFGKSRVRLISYTTASSSQSTSRYSCEFYGPDYGDNNSLKILDYDMTTKAYIDINPTTVTALNFTGQHRCFIQSLPFSNVNELYGLIVCANTNKHVKMNDGIATGNSAITINESLPVLSICKSELDTTCFGVISEPENNKRSINYGVFATVLDRETGDNRVIINSIGEGAIWVSNKNGILESGDYITTSLLPGYGQKQSDEFMCNYTVAKITMDCDFSPSLQPVQQVKTINTIMYQNIQHTSNIISETDYNLLPFDEQQLYIQSNITTNDLDINGNIQWVNTTQLEYPYNIRYLDASGNIITKTSYEYMLSNQLNAYIAAFVSCTYHCG